MRVFIATVNGGTLLVDIEASNDIKRLTTKIEEHTGVCPNYQRLLFNNVQLHSEKALGEQGVTDGCTIHLLFPLRGGMLTSDQLSGNLSLEELFAEGAPKELLDPISECLFRDPVISATSGRTFSRETLQQYRMKDPFTREKLNPKQLIPNRDKQSEVEVYVGKKLKEMITELKYPLTDSSTASRIHTLIRITLERSEMTPCLNAQRQVVDVLHGRRGNELRQFISNCQPQEREMLVRLTQRREDASLASLLGISLTQTPTGMSASASASPFAACSSPSLSEDDETNSPVQSLGLWVGSLDLSVTNSDLKAHFSEFESSIVSAHVSRLPGGKSKGVGFVNFSSWADRQTACCQLKGSKLKGRPIKLSIKGDKSSPSNVSAGSIVAGMSHSETTTAKSAGQKEPSSPIQSLGLWVGSLDLSVTSNDLEAHFSGFKRSIGSIDVARSSDGKSKGFGFVNFSSWTDRETACRQLQGSKLKGKTIKLSIKADKSSPRTATAGSFADTIGFGTTSEASTAVASDSGTVPKSFGVKISKVPAHTSDGELLQMGLAYGLVVSVNATCAKEGYSYINYATLQEAQAAVAGLNGRNFSGKMVRAKLQKTVAHRISESRLEPLPVSTEIAFDKDVDEPPSPSNQVQSPGGLSSTKTYSVKVTNMSSQTTEQQLATLACSYGRVSSIAMKKGFAFINFTNKEEAQAAAAALNGLRLGDRAIRALVQGAQSGTPVAPLAPIHPSHAPLSSPLSYPPVVAPQAIPRPIIQSPVQGLMPSQMFHHSPPTATNYAFPQPVVEQTLPMSDDSFNFAKKRFEADVHRFELLGVTIKHSSQQQCAVVRGPPEHVSNAVMVLGNVKEVVVPLNGHEWSYLMDSGTTGSNRFRDLYVPWATNPDVAISALNHTSSIKFTGCSLAVAASQEHILSFRYGSMPISLNQMAALLETQPQRLEQIKQCYRVAVVGLQVGSESVVFQGESQNIANARQCFSQLLHSYREQAVSVSTFLRASLKRRLKNESLSVAVLEAQPPQREQKKRYDAILCGFDEQQMAKALSIVVNGPYRREIDLQADIALKLTKGSEFSLRKLRNKYPGLSVSDKIIADGKFVIEGFVAEDVSAAANELEAFACSAEVKKENLDCSKGGSIYLEEILVRNPREGSLAAKMEIERQRNVKITFDKRFVIEGSSKNVAAAQQDVKLSPLLLGGFAQKTFTKPGSKVTETLVLKQVVQPLLRSMPHLVVKMNTKQQGFRRRRDSEKDPRDEERDSRAGRVGVKGRDSSREREKRKAQGNLYVKIHVYGPAGDVAAAEEKIESYRPSFYCWRLPRSWSSCLQKEHRLNLQAVALGIDAQVCVDWSTDNNCLHIAAESREATEEFRQEVQAYLDDHVRWKETKSLSGNEARFLQELRWEQIQGARRPEQALDISLGKADGESRRELVAKGVKVAVDTASKRIDDYLEGLREDVVKLTYPLRLKWAMEARLKEICQEAKAVLDVVAYFRKLSETKETLKTDVHLLGVDQDSMESVKSKIDDLGAPVSLEMKMPQKMTGKLRAKALDIAKEHNVGIDFSNSAVTVFAITADDLEIAKESMVALFEDKASVSDSFLCGDSLIMKLMSSKMKGDVVCMAKDQGVFVHPDKSGSKIILRGSKKHIEGLKQKLEVFVAQIAATLVEDSITLDGLHAAALYVPSVVAKVNSLQSDHNVVVTSPRKSRTTVVVNELKVQSVGGSSRVLQVCLGSIVDEAVDAIVNAANESLVHAGGVARALCNAGGHQVHVESNDYVSSHGKLHTGQAVALSGGDLKCRHLIHVVSPRCTPGRCTDVERELMKIAVTNSLIQCDKVGAQSVAFPALGTGIFQFPVGECAEIMVSEITQYLMSKSTSSINVARVMLVDESIAREFDRVVRCRRESSSLNQAATSGRGSMSTSLAKYQWKFCNDTGAFQAYDGAASNDMERLYTLNSGGKFSLMMNGFPYEIDLAGMTQTNKQTGKRRSIRRDLVTSVSQSDAQWYYRDDTGLFVRYDALSNNHLEAARAAGKNRITMRINQFVYEVDLAKYQQTNTESGKVRIIKRDQPEGQVLEASGIIAGFLASVESCEDIGGPPEATFEPVVVKIRGQRGDVPTAKGKLLSILTSSCSKRSVPIPANLTKVMEKQLNRFRRKHSVKVSFTGQTVGDVKVVAEIEGIRANVDKAVSAVQMKIIELQSERGSEVELPSEWEVQSSVVELKPVGAGNVEWARVLALMKTTLPNVTLVNLERVQNQWLWEQYVHHKERMARKNNGAVNEKDLFHGTRSADPSLIYKGEEGFDMRFSAQGMWGTGCYFAVNASYSHSYSYRLSDGSHQMFLAKVLTGDSADIPSDRSLRMPPKKSDVSAFFGENRYDTVTGVTGGSRVYITYKNDKAYPFYLITYI